MPMLRDSERAGRAQTPVVPPCCRSDADVLRCRHSKSRHGGTPSPSEALERYAVCEMTAAHSEHSRTRRSETTRYASSRPGARHVENKTERCTVTSERDG